MEKIILLFCLFSTQCAVTRMRGNSALTGCGTPLAFLRQDMDTVAGAIVRADKAAEVVTDMPGEADVGPAEDAFRAVFPTIDGREFRNALAGFPTGVTVVTARSDEGRVAGVTVNAFCSVSLAPPLLLWCLSKAAPSRVVFEAASHFAIHVLAANQGLLSRRFSRASRDKFAGLEVGEGLGGAPTLGGVVALFECRRARCHDGGDHIIIIGTVERYRYSRREPLVFHSGDLGGLGRER